MKYGEKKRVIVETLENAIGNGVSMTSFKWGEALGVSDSYVRLLAYQCNLQKALSGHWGESWQPESMRVFRNARIPARVLRAAGFNNGQSLIARAEKNKIVIIPRD